MYCYESDNKIDINRDFSFLSLVNMNFNGLENLFRRILLLFF